jgi:hypothetical protein
VDLITFAWFGGLCYVLGVVSGKWLLPWLVDHYPLIRDR